MNNALSGKGDLVVELELASGKNLPAFLRLTQQRAYNVPLHADGLEKISQVRLVWGKAVTLQ
jgi:hypothetical protein